MYSKLFSVLGELVDNLVDEDEESTGNAKERYMIRRLEKMEDELSELERAVATCDSPFGPGGIFGNTNIRAAELRGEIRKLKKKLGL